MPRPNFASMNLRKYQPARCSWWAWDESGQPVPREHFTERARHEANRMAGGIFGKFVPSSRAVAEVRTPPITPAGYPLVIADEEQVAA